MSVHNPHGWVIVKIEGVEPHYRVFASWRGGYVSGDSWQLNSGVKDCIYDPAIQCYKFYGYSGSVYICSRRTYGDITAFNQSALDLIINKSDNKMVVLEDCDWATVNWNITK